jgi:DNA (cytosine-5)-methyltransferase 1
MASPPSFVSLFSGCGGLDYGFIETGFRCLNAFDIDESVVAVHKLNLDNRARVTDLAGLSPDQMQCFAAPDVVVSGSPCQGFSTAGKRDFHDPRNSLLVHGGHIAVALKPKVFVAENVAGALAGDHRAYWNELDGIWRGAGYRTTTIRVNAGDVGIAQRRSRVVLLAWKTKRDLSLPTLRPTTVTLRHALEGVLGQSEHDKRMLVRGSTGYLIAKHIKRGQKLSNVRNGESAVHTWEIPEVFGRTTALERRVLETILILRRRDRVRAYGDADPVPLRTLRKELGLDVASPVASLVDKGYLRRLERRIDLVHTFNGKYKRPEWTSSSIAVDTKFGDPRYFLHPSEHRGFTVREAARIQGFPDTFSFSGIQRAAAYRMIGNAVPPPLGRYLAGLVKSLF